MRLRIARAVAYLVVAVVMVSGGAPTFADVLQIDSTDPSSTALNAPWDRTSATQTGKVGMIPVTITTDKTPFPWYTTFNNDRTSYASGLYGSLRQPGTVGDFLNHHVRPGDNFKTTIALGGPLLNPIIFVGDIDAVGASVVFPSGASTFAVSDDGSLLGNTVTALRGAMQPIPGTNPQSYYYGAFAAAQYDGLFPEGSLFELTFDFPANDDNWGAENVGIGIASAYLAEEDPERDEKPRPELPRPEENDGPKGGAAVPEPATMSLLGLALLGLFGYRVKND